MPRVDGSHRSWRDETGAGWVLERVWFWWLEIRHSTPNPASCEVARRAGFVHEATLGRQHLHDDGWHEVHIHSRHREPPPASGPTPVASPVGRSSS